MQSFNRLLLTVLLKALGTLTRGESDRAVLPTIASMLKWTGLSMNFVNPCIVGILTNGVACLEMADPQELFQQDMIRINQMP